MTGPPTGPDSGSSSGRTSTRPPAAASISTQLLVEMVINPLDLGYDAAARRRGGIPGRRWYDAPAVAIGCLLIGFVLVVAYVHTHRGAPAEAKDHQQLVARVQTADKADTALAAQAQRLAAQLGRIRASAGAGSAQSDVTREQLAAGQTPVTGPGLTVTLTERTTPSATTAPPGRVGSTPIAASNILTDRDVRSVVNELWADGAEAIAVNGVRLAPTSAIRFAGEAVLVDFQPISSPYRVEAIGNADDLDTGFAASSVAGRYHTLASADGIGFDFTEHSALHLPAAAAVTPRYAQPVTSPTEGSR